MSCMGRRVSAVETRRTHHLTLALKSFVWLESLCI